MHRILRSRNVVTSSAIRAATVHIRDGVIDRIGEYDDRGDGAPVDDFGDLTLMAGIVDSHVHVNEPGRTEWEGFETATRAAAAGGVTTLVDMPLNSIPPTISVDALLRKAEAMDGKCRIDVGLWGGAVPGNAPQLRDMLDHGALGFKCFLVDSGVEEFRHLSAEDVETALRALHGTDAPLLVHAELPDPIAEAARAGLPDDPRAYQRWLRSRPRAAEDQAIELLARLCADTGTHAHVVHLSSAGGLDILRRARDRKLPLTAETTPHYLYFESEHIPDGAPEYKCAPPIREHDNREQLWRGLRDGLLIAVVSDHSPCTPELKHLAEGNVDAAWGGIASLQFGLPIVWTEGHRRGLTLPDLSLLMSEGPARLAGISSRKGRLAPGYDADLVVWSPDETFVVDPARIEHRHKVTPYARRELRGVVKATYVRGTKVWEDGAHVGGPTGRWVKR